MSVLSRPEFHDEAKAFEHVESILWPNGPVCPKCGSVDRHYALKGVRTKPSKKNLNGVERHCTSAARAVRSSPFAWARSSRKAICRSPRRSAKRTSSIHRSFTILA